VSRRKAAATDPVISAYFRELGRKGGKSRASKLSSQRRREIAQLGVDARMAQIRQRAKSAKKEEATT
jgi:hypothetical protein